MRHAFHDVFDLFGEPQNPQIAFANFSVPILINVVAGGYKTAGFLYTPTGGRRFMLYEAEFGQTTPAAGYAATDVSCEWDISRAATPTLAGTSVAANALDPADTTAAVTLFGQLATNEPTYTTTGNGLNLKHWAINQRGSYRWRALDDGDNLIGAISAGVGMGIRVSSGAYNSSAVGGLSFVER